MWSVYIQKLQSKSYFVYYLKFICLYVHLMSPSLLLFFDMQGDLVSLDQEIYIP